MIVRLWNPIERGRPAVWLHGAIENDPLPVRWLARQLREHPGKGPVDLIVDGDGGNVARAEEMIDVLRAEPRPKRVTILRAMSAHGLVAMVGDHIRIVEGGAIGLHDSRLSRDCVLSYMMDAPMPATTLRALAATCERTDAEHVEVFARRTGLPPAAIVNLRAAETTLDAHEAVRLGFADEVIPYAR